MGHHVMQPYDKESYLQGIKTNKEKTNTKQI